MKKISASLWTLVFGLGVSAAFACPKEDAKVENKGDCGKSALKVADPVKDGRSETADNVKKDTPCSKSATTVAEKKPCGSGCGEGCPCKKASLTGDKAPCAHSATAATDKKGGCDKPCHGKSYATADGDSGCPIGAKVKAVLASLPSVKYRVGEEIVGCSESAAAMAEKTGKPIAFVVGDETFKEQPEAMAKLASLLEEEVNAMQSILFVAGGKWYKCPMTAKSVAADNGGKVLYRVAGVDFETQEAAEKALEKVREAAAKVALSYKVGDKTYGCDKEAGEKSKESGAKLTYVVGEEETGCQTMAKVKLAEAKIRTIVETAVTTSMSL